MGTPSGTPPGDGTRPRGADFPLPPRRPSGSSISTETPSRSSSDTSPSRTTGSDTESVSVRHRQTPSSFDRSIDISMMGANRRDYCFSFFSLKSGDFAEDARLNLLVAVFRSFSSKQISIAKDEKKKQKKKKQKKLRNIRCFLFLLTYYHLAFDDLCIFVKNEI